MTSRGRSPVIWVLTDDRPGNVSQSIGVARALGLPFEEIALTYHWKAGLPNRVIGPGLLGLTADCAEALRQRFAEKPPRLVIAAGRRTAPVALWIRAQRRKQKRRIRLVQLMHPQLSPGTFDLLVLPAHDQPRGGRHVLEVQTPPHKLSKAALQQAHEQWEERFAPLKPPYITVVVGGNTTYGRFGEAAATHLGEGLERAAKAMQGAPSFLVTTSRRTAPEASAALRHALTRPCHYFDWGSDGGAENPYLGMLAMADYVVVTGDSMSMIAEAVYTGAPVYIATEGDQISPKHRRLHEALFDAGVARPFEGRLEAYRYVPLDSAHEIAARIQSLLE